MSFLKRNSVITGTAVIIFISAFSWWIFSTPSYNVTERVPGLDNRPPVKPISDLVIIGEFTERFGDPEEIVPGSWPRFRGEYFDNISRDQTPLAESWDTSGLPLVWQMTLGEGYAGPAVLNGRVYVLDYSEKWKADMLQMLFIEIR
jgi:outer membrane protein assembly factor BamB